MKIDFVFLLKAIKENTNIYLYHRKDDKEIRYFSRFFRVDSNTRSITIDAPYVDGYIHHPLVKGDPVSVVFHSAGFRFHFDSLVEEEVRFSPGDGLQIPALKITWPADILDGNRRSLYRLTVYMDPCIKVYYKMPAKYGNPHPAPGLVNQLESQLKRQQGRQPGNEGENQYEGVEAIMIDISQSGIAVRMNRPRNIDIGDSLILSFCLEENQKSLTIEGITRNIRQLPGSDIHICGIQFTADKTTLYKRALQEIACYLMSHNRESIAFFTVNQIVSKNPYVQKIVDNEVTEDTLKMVLAKQLPFSEEEYLESLVYILKIEKYHQLAAAQLELIPFEVKRRYIERSDANHRVAYYILTEGLNHFYTKIIAAVINNQYLPMEFMAKIAEQGSEKILRMLAAGKTKLIAFPEIMEIMEENPEITEPILEKIQDIRNSYLMERSGTQIAETDVIDHVTSWMIEEVNALVTRQDQKNGWDEKNGITDGIEEDVKREKKEGKTGEKNKTTGDAADSKRDDARQKALELLEKINNLSVQERIKLAFKGSKAERLILTKDPNIHVVMGVVNSPNVTEKELLAIIEDRNTPKEAIAKICRNKTWAETYTIIFALLRNLKIPGAQAPVLLKKLRLRDLQQLAADKTISPVVRNLARHLLEKKD